MWLRSWVGSSDRRLCCSLGQQNGPLTHDATSCVLVVHSYDDYCYCSDYIYLNITTTGMVWARRACEGRTELAFAMTLRLRFGFRGITTRAPFRCVDGTEFRKIRVCCAVTDYANALRAATTSTSPQPSCNTRALLRAGSRHNQCIVNPHAAEDSTRSLTMQQAVLARPATSKGPYPHLIEWWHALQP